MRASTFLNTVLALSLLLVSLSLTSVTPTAAQPAACPNAPKPLLVVGRQAHVTPGAANNLRQQPSRSALSLTMVRGDEYVDVIAGPTCADNLAWWKVQYNGQTGWMAEGSGNTYYVEPTTSDIWLFGLIGNNQTVAINYGGVSLMYNGSFGKLAEVTKVFAVKASPNNPFWYPAPAFVEIRFPDAAQLPYRIPKVSVYPVADYQRVSGFANTQIPLLRALLKTKSADPSDNIPALPPVNAGEIFHSNVKYLTFGNGTGVRFLTIFSQGFAPITNESLYYIFQGLTADGKYLVTGWFPISASILPATAAQATDFPDLSSPQSADLFKAYMQKMTGRLNAAAPSAFTPNLEQIDTMLQSVTIVATGQ